MHRNVSYFRSKYLFLSLHHPAYKRKAVRHSFKSHSTTPTKKIFFFFENTKHKCINPRRLVVYTKTAPFSARAHNRIGFRLQTGTPQKENRNVQNNGPRSDPHELTSKEYTQGVLVSAHTEKCARNLHTSPHKLSLSNSLPPVLNHSKPTMNDRDFCLLNTKKKRTEKKRTNTQVEQRKTCSK